MKKKDDDEFGVLITREMKAMLADERLSYDQKGKIMCAIIGDEPIEDVMMNAFAESLKVGYISTNNKRKAEIYARRERQRGYQRNLRQSTNISVDAHSSTEQTGDARASLNKAKQSNVDNIPLNPPSGVEGEIPPAISADDLLVAPHAEPTKETRAAAATFAEEIEKGEAFGHMRVNPNKLVKCLVSVFKKNAGAEAEIRKGLAKWTPVWAAAGWRWAPGKITDWIYDGKYLEEPRATAPAVSGQYDDVGVKEIV